MGQGNKQLRVPILINQLSFYSIRFNSQSDLPKFLYLKVLIYIFMARSLLGAGQKV